MNRRLLRSIAGALFVALCCTVGPVFAKATNRAEAASFQPKVEATPACTASQVRFTYFGESAAAGTAVTELVASDDSVRACAIGGYPRVLFFGGSFANRHAMTIRITHTGPGVAFSKDPGRVVLDPGASRTSRAPHAAVVITTADFALDGSGACPQVTSIEIGLSATDQMTRVPLWYPANICGTTASADVSSFFSDPPELYAMPAIAPICNSSELAITTASAGAGLSHVGLILRFRNPAPIPCRISGYPAVVLIGAGGSRIAGAVATPFGYLGGLAPDTGPPPLVTLEPGGSASSLLEAVDFETKNKGACPAVDSLLVEAPASAQSIEVTTRFGGCSDVEVHPLLAGTTGKSSN